jgi:hypothetical protein
MCTSRGGFGQCRTRRLDFLLLCISDFTTDFVQADVIEDRLVCDHPVEADASSEDRYCMPSDHRSAVQMCGSTSMSTSTDPPNGRLVLGAMSNCRVAGEFHSRSAGGLADHGIAA